MNPILHLITKQGTPSELAHMYDLRPATATDVAAMLAIYRPFIEDGFASFEEEVPSLDEFERRRIHYQATAPWLVATHQGQVIGYAYAAAHRGRPAYRWTKELSVYLHPDHQGHGVGRVLYAALLDVLSWQGYANVLAGVALPNPASERFHEKMGMQLIGTYHRVGFKHGRFCDVRWYELFIGNPDEPVGIIKDLPTYWQGDHWSATRQKAIGLMG